jgi:hypothetical protein
MSKEQLPINNQIEPDFLEYIKRTFKHWQDVNDQGQEVGVRELSNFAFTLKGAYMNSHFGFLYNFNPRGADADNNPAITLKIWTNKNSNMATSEPQFEFYAPYVV